MKKKYSIEVDCANCASLMENAVSKLDGVNSVSINFIMQKMILDIDDSFGLEPVLKSVQKACKRIEPDCEIMI